ncbi:uracil-DNA glycosylase [Marivirga harenae]|uniref:uracil-DNA glycosylase n=1 Tax=Marivirga harenae TaxID=2010992 RepID=UPI0026E001DF|nr:uracil-DNA glycosylase [Marivirga harenae]WKV11664.1 uracil-DNA glycosylase [Marivirga harenae]|tara:strand:- start:172631 stop:173293 length:663 start_codon:yes stop_codon:yes gene_type:complete
MQVKIEQSWKNRLSKEFTKDYFLDLAKFVKSEYQNKTVYPPAKEIFKAFDACPFDQVKVVILGQDPYHGIGQANGLCFSVHPGVAMPPSLVNIFKERKADLGKSMPPNGDLTGWAKQGVLLLNATLTVAAKSPGSHQKRGWENFTDSVIHKLSSEKENLVFILWGAYAQKKGAIIDRSKHFIIESAHPSPFSAHRGFFGSKPFGKCNEYLTSQQLEAVEW